MKEQNVLRCGALVFWLQEKQTVMAKNHPTCQQIFLPSRGQLWWIITLGKIEGISQTCMPSIIHPSIHPSGSRGQQSKQRQVDFPLAGHIRQFSWDDSKVFPGQLGDSLSPTSPGSSPGGLRPGVGVGTQSEVCLWQTFLLFILIKVSHGYCLLKCLSLFLAAGAHRLKIWLSRFALNFLVQKDQISYSCEVTYMSVGNFTFFFGVYSSQRFSHEDQSLEASIYWLPA